MGNAAGAIFMGDRVMFGGLTQCWLEYRVQKNKDDATIKTIKRMRRDYWRSFYRGQHGHKFLDITDDLRPIIVGQTAIPEVKRQ